MKPAIAATLCKVTGHPGLRALARTVKDSGRQSAMLFWRCPRCAVEIISIDVGAVPQQRRTTQRRAA